MDEFRKIRGDAKLNHLAPDQQAEVFTHCESATLDEGLNWIKAQFDIELSRQCLGRWLKKHRIDFAAAARLKEIRQARDHSRLIGKVMASAAELTEANTVLIAQAVFEELMKDEKDRDETRIAKYMAVALRARENEIREKSVNLAAIRFRFDASKAVLREAARLKDINQGPEDEQAKIEKVMLLLFGPKPDGFSVPPGKENA